MLFTGLLGFLAADFGDRYLATKSAASLPQAIAAETAPMDWKRWLLGAGLTALGILPGHFIQFSPALRAVMQGFGYGAGLRTVGKGASDGIAYLTSSTNLGTRLYAPENTGRAYVAQTTTPPPAPGTHGLPEGVGAPQECPTCKRTDGLGACCRSSYAGAPHRMTSPPLQNTSTIPQQPEQPEQPLAPPPVSMTPPVARVPAPTPPPPDNGGGGSTVPVPTNNVPANPLTSSIPAGSAMPLLPTTPALAGLPNNGFGRMGGMQQWDWGAKEDREA